MKYKIEEWGGKNHTIIQMGNFYLWIKIKAHSTFFIYKQKMLFLKRRMLGIILYTNSFENADMSDHRLEGEQTEQEPLHS